MYSHLIGKFFENILKNKIKIGDIPLEVLNLKNIFKKSFSKFFLSLAI